MAAILSPVQTLSWRECWRAMSNAGRSLQDTAGCGDTFSRTNACTSMQRCLYVWKVTRTKPSILKLSARKAGRRPEKHVLGKMLEREAETSTPEIRRVTCLSPENYEFHMVGSGLLRDGMAYIIDVVPRRHDQNLFEGRIWIDAQDYAVARIEGKPAKNPSFWIHSVHFVHTYRKSGPFWFPASTESVTDARIFGSTSLTIHYFNYTPSQLQTPETASAVSQGGLTP